MLTKILCFLGIHEWEKDPAKKDIIRGTGVHFAFTSESYQKAERVCTRPGCSAHQKVYRYGWCGLGGTASGWKKLSLRREEYIDKLPNVFQV